MSFSYQSTTDHVVRLKADNRPDIVIQPQSTVELTLFDRHFYHQSIREHVWKNEILPLQGGGGGGDYPPDLSTIDLVEGKLHAKRATESTHGTVMVDGSTIKIDTQGIIYGTPPTATVNVEGIVTPDNTTIGITNGSLFVKAGTSEHIGGVKADGVTTTIEADGTIHAADAYELPVASETVLGGVKVDGSSITVQTDGTISATGGTPPDPYQLPIATETTLGGIKPDGSTITVDPITGVAVASGGSPYELPIASESELGGVKIDGTTISITGDGTISAVGGGGGIPPDGVTLDENEQGQMYAKFATDGNLAGIVKADGLSTKITSYSGAISAYAWKSIATVHSTSTYCRQLGYAYRSSVTQFFIEWKNGTQDLGNVAGSLVVTVWVDSARNVRHNLPFDLPFEFSWKLDNDHSAVMFYISGVAQYPFYDDWSVWFQAPDEQFRVLSEDIDKPDEVNPIIFADSIITASEDRYGVVKPDGITTVVDEEGIISAIGGGGGGIPPDMESIDIEDGKLHAIQATGTSYGTVRGDNLTAFVDDDGIISAAAGISYVLPTATTTVLGGVRISANTSGAQANWAGVTLNSAGQLAMQMVDNNVTAGAVSIGSGNTNGQIEYYAGRIRTKLANTDYAGVVKPDGLSILVDGNGVISVAGGESGNPPDMTTINLVDGKLHAITATGSTWGTVKGDGISTFISEDGIISATGGSGEGFDPDMDTITLQNGKLHVADVSGTRGQIEQGYIESAVRSVKDWVDVFIANHNGLISIFMGFLPSWVEWQVSVPKKYEKPSQGIPTTDLATTTGTKGDDSLDILESATRRIDQWLTVLMNRINGLINRTKPATEGALGTIKPDGSTTSVDADGTLHAVGGGGSGWINVNLSDLCDGETLEFPHTFPNPNLVKVYLNGLKLCKDTNYTITGTMLTLTTVPPIEGDVLELEIY